MRPKDPSAPVTGSATRVGRKTPRLLGCLLVLAAAMAACSDEAPVSGPGTLTATLVSPNGAEGAALVVIVGEGIGEITPAGQTRVFSRGGAHSTQVVLVHEPGGDLTFRIAVADTTAPPTAVIQEVAGTDDELRADLTEYRLEYAR